MTLVILEMSFNNEENPIIGTGPILGKNKDTYTYTNIIMANEGA